MLLPFSHLHQPDGQPELPRELALPTGVDRGRDQAREKFDPFLKLARPEANEHPREPREFPKNASPRQPMIPAPMPMLPRQRSFDVLPPMRSESGLQESVTKGTVAAGLGTAAITAALPAFEKTVIGPTTDLFLASGVLPSATQMGVSLGVPAVGAAAGYAIGKRFGHPVAGTAIGTGAGMAGSLWAMTLPVVANSGITAAATSVVSASALSSLPMTAGISTAVGGALYGLGRLHGRVWGSRPGGLLRTMARGVVAPVSVPLGFVRKFARR